LHEELMVFYHLYYDVCTQCARARARVCVCVCVFNNKLQEYSNH